MPYLFLFRENDVFEVFSRYLHPIDLGCIKSVIAELATESLPIFCNPYSIFFIKSTHELPLQIQIYSHPDSFLLSQNRFK